MGFGVVARLLGWWVNAFAGVARRLRPRGGGGR